MRKKLLHQLPLTPAPIDHAHAAELAVISSLLDSLPEAAALVHADLSWRKGQKVNTALGRDGLTAEQVLRVGVLKQHIGVSYELMAFSLLDSNTYRSFCRIGIGARPPKKSTLQKNVKRVKATTWEAINTLVIRKARDLGIDDGKKVRTDCTVVESNIHHPTDSTLLGDCVRVLDRLMKQARDDFSLPYSSHRLRAKRRVLGISNARSAKARLPLYKDLLATTSKVVSRAETTLERLKTVRCSSPKEAGIAGSISAQIERFVPLTRKVISQTERRVLRGEKVPVEEKIVSIFEDHTDIILKGGREVEYGHKICLTTTRTSLVTGAFVESGNPADSTLAVRSIEQHRQAFGVLPRQACFDGGFASKENVATIKELGVKDVVFHKRRGLSVEEMTTSKRTYKRLRAFRAGIEGTISFLKRAFGLARCFWRGWHSFQAYVQASVLACNLLVVSRHIIAARS